MDNLCYICYFMKRHVPFIFLNQHLISMVTTIKTGRRIKTTFSLSILEITKQTLKFKGDRMKIPYQITSASEILVNYKIIYQ